MVIYTLAVLPALANYSHVYEAVIRLRLSFLC